MLILAHHIGRLLECRIASPTSDAELKSFEAECACLRGILGEDRLVCMDLRRLSVLPPTLADRLTGLLSGNAPGLLRNAVLLPKSAVAALQIDRIVREADNPHRRTFRDRAEAAAWLGEVATVVERARLEAFLDEGDRAP